MVRGDHGKTKVMACILAFGSGMDYPSIHYNVMFKSTTYGLMTMPQMAGQATSGIARSPPNNPTMQEGWQ